MDALAEWRKRVQVGDTVIFEDGWEFTRHIGHVLAAGAKRFLAYIPDSDRHAWVIISNGSCVGFGDKVIPATISRLKGLAEFNELAKRVRRVVGSGIDCGSRRSSDEDIRAALAELRTAKD